MTEESPMPAAEPMTQEIVERLKELLAKATDAEAERIRVRDLYSEDFSPEAEAACAQAYRDAREAKGELAREAINALPALLSTLTNPTPSGVERIQLRANIAKSWRRFGGICRLARSAEGRIKLLDAAVNEAIALALPSEPPSQGDVERRAVRLWALLDEIDTLDDACRSNDAVFRESVRVVQQKRFAIMSGKEWDLAREAYAND